VVQRVFHLESETTTAVGHQPLQTRIEKYDFGDLSVVAIKGSAQRVVVRDWASASTLCVILPRTPDGFIEIEGVRQALMPGRAYVVNARGSVLLEVPDEFEHITLRLSCASSELTRFFSEPREPGALLLTGGVAATLVSTVLTLYSNALEIDEKAAPMVARAIVELLYASLAETACPEGESSQTLEAYHRHRIRQVALAGLGDPELSVESIAVAVGLSTRRIHQLFADSDMTLMRWIWSERLARCHSRLVDGTSKEARIGAVAYEWGFSDPAHFSRVFRQRYGATPQQHMRLNRARNPT
jgi:AraC-like DNA-binding protein